MKHGKSRTKTYGAAYYSSEPPAVQDAFRKAKLAENARQSAQRRKEGERQ